MYSAKKIAGRKLYELARRGEEVERKSVQVTVSEFEAIALGGELLTPGHDGSCDLRVRVVCSAGTYIRTLAEDFGRRLGLGAHVASLRRTRAGRFTIAESFALERLGELAESHSVGTALISSDAAIAHLPAVNLQDDDVSRTFHGIDMRIEGAADAQWSDCQPVRMRDAGGDLIAVGIYYQSRRTIHPKVVIANSSEAL